MSTSLSSRRTFHFHPLAIEDAINDIHLPKIDDYGTYLYLVFHTVALGQEPMDIETEEVDVFLGLNYLITIHDQPRRSIDRAWDTEHHLASRAGAWSGNAALRVVGHPDRLLHPNHRCL